MLDTNLIKANNITVQRLSTGADITLNTLNDTTWNNVLDGAFDVGTHNVPSCAYYANISDTGALLTMWLGDQYEISDFYMLSAYFASRSIYAYEIYVGDNQKTLYTDENLVLSYNYSGYTTDNTIGKLNTANGCYWNADPTAPIVSDTAFSPIYIKKTEKIFNLTINDGSTTISKHAFDDEINFTAKGEGFAYWKDAVTGSLISTEPKCSMYMPGNLEVTAIYNAEVPKKETVQLYSAVNFINSDETYTAILTARTDLPEGAVIESKGIIFTSESGYAQAGGNITVDMTGNYIINAKKNVNGNYMITYKKIKNGRVRYAKAYVTYVLNGETTTDYSNYTAVFNGEVQ